MEIRLLRYFSEVERNKNIFRAAEVLHIGQPTAIGAAPDHDFRFGSTAKMTAESGAFFMGNFLGFCRKINVAFQPRLY